MYALIPVGRRPSTFAAITRVSAAAVVAGRIGGRAFGQADVLVRPGRDDLEAARQLSGCRTGGRRSRRVRGRCSRPRSDVHPA
ncbi:MAG: hypothetical protein MZU97_13540 [Bacillus subtilis]|nr:hypothetical protein [Bacillus subtilis]